MLSKYLKKQLPSEQVAETCISIYIKVHLGLNQESCLLYIISWIKYLTYIIILYDFIDGQLLKEPRMIRDFLRFSSESEAEQHLTPGGKYWLWG